MKTTDLEVSNQFHTYYWTPSLIWSHFVVQTGVSSVYTVADSGVEWLQPNNPANASSALCANGCAEVTMQTTVETAQPFEAFTNYANYPFDRHTVIFRFGIDRASLDCATALAIATNASEASTASAMSTEEKGKALGPVVLPTSGEWQLDSSKASPVVVRNAGSDSCELVVFLERNYGVQMIKSLLLSILTVAACLAGNYMHPADHTGDRAAIVLVASLILTSNINADLGLGPINYLIWMDYFNLILMGVTFIALIQTMVVHRYWSYSDQQGLAITIDRVCTATILYFLFPLLVLGDICMAFPNVRATGLALIITGPLIALVAVVVIVRRRQAQHARKESAAVAALMNSGVSMDAEEREAQLRASFDVFDRDQTGYLTIPELRRDSTRPQTPASAPRFPRPSPLKGQRPSCERERVSAHSPTCASLLRQGCCEPSTPPWT